MRLLAKLAFLSLALGVASVSVAKAQLPYDGRRDHRPPPRVFFHHHYHHFVPPHRDDYRR